MEEVLLLTSSGLLCGRSTRLQPEHEVRAWSTSSAWVSFEINSIH